MNKFIYYNCVKSSIIKKDIYLIKCNAAIYSNSIKQEIIGLNKLMKKKKYIYK